ncbi:MAG: ROK family transcriptional regulator [Candidatus Omnitrophota bacterium]
MVGIGKNFLKESNRRLILKVIYENSPISRTQIVRHTNLSKVTVTRIVNELIKSGLVFEGEQTASSGGRPQVLIRLIPDARYAIGADIGISDVKIGVCDLRCNVLFKLEKKITPKIESNKLAELLFNSVKELIRSSNVHADKVLGVGISMPGVIDADKGIVKSSFILSERNVPLEGILENKLKLNVVVDRDANAGLFYERFMGKGKDIDDILYIYTRKNEAGEMGVGCSFLLDSQIYRGADYCAGEIGLAHSDDEKEAIFEPFSSYESIPFRNAMQAAKNGDEQANKILFEVGEKIGQGISFLVNLLNPKLVIVGGDFSMAGEPFFKSLANSLERHIFDFSTKDIKLESSSADEYSGIKAAAFMVIAKTVGYK